MGVPGPLGGHNWYPMAFSPKTGLVYIPTNEAGFPYLADQLFKVGPVGMNLGIDLNGGPMPSDAAIKKASAAASKGYLQAWDPVNQKMVWRADHPGPANGGVVATAGNLVLQGEYAGKFLAYRADTGAKLWSFDAQAPIIAAPMTYETGGEQYVAVMTCGGGAYGLAAGSGALYAGMPRKLCRLLAFKLGGQAQLPPAPKVELPPLNPPPLTASPASIQQGFHLFGRYCAICHGGGGVSAGVLPDLRHSAYLNSDAGFQAVVRDGAMKEQGMVSFAPVLSADDAESIRGYLVKQAHLAQEAQGPSG